MSSSQNVERLETILAALGSLADSMVFTGGAVVELYSETERKYGPRATKDIDSIVSAATIGAYHTLEAELHARGFVNAGLAGQGGPTCRYIYQGILFDVMPANENVLGFSNPWFKHALEEPFEKKLPSGRTIQLASFPRFLAIKLVALAERGGLDVRGSHDLEDIVRLLAGRRNPVQEIESEIPAIREFIFASLADFLKKGSALEAVRGATPLGAEQANEIYELMKQLSSRNGKKTIPES